MNTGQWSAIWSVFLYSESFCGFISGKWWGNVSHWVQDKILNVSHTVSISLVIQCTPQGSSFVMGMKLNLCGAIWDCVSVFPLLCQVPSGNSMLSLHIAEPGTFVYRALFFFKNVIMFSVFPHYLFTTVMALHSLVAVSRGYSLAVVHRLLTELASLVGAPGLWSTGSIVVAQGLSCSALYRIVPDWDGSGVSCVGKWTLNHWATREALVMRSCGWCK